MKGKVSEKVVVRERLSSVRGSLLWKCEGEGFRKSGCKRGVSTHQGGLTHIRVVLPTSG